MALETRLSGVTLRFCLTLFVRFACSLVHADVLAACKRHLSS